MTASTSAARLPARAARAASAGIGFAGIGRVYVWNGGSLWIGRSAGSGGLHAHHALQIALPLQGTVRFRCSLREAWQDYAGAVVRPHVAHQFDGCGGHVAQVFVEPETALGRVLLDLADGQPIAPLERAQVRPLVQPLFERFDALRAAGGDHMEAMQAATQAALRQLACCAPSPPPLDARIARVLEVLRTRVAQPPTLAEAAALAHLSPGRFRHLFVAQTGSSYRAYLLWLRLQAAVAGFNQRTSWTEAAHAAGFADSAHLSRSFKRMFGVSPVALVRE